MAAIDFWARINPDGTLPVPPDVAARIPGERPIRVIVLLAEESSEDQAWEHLTADQFLNGYADSDAIYDDVPIG